MRSAPATNVSEPCPWFNKSSAVAELGDRVTTTDIGRKVGGGCAPLFFGGGSWVPMEHNAAWAKAHRYIKWYFDP